MTHPLVRVYFNKHGELPWSVDTGPGTEEFQTGAVIFVGLEGYTVFSPHDGDNVVSPTAWIECRNAYINRDSNDLILSVREIDIGVKL